MNLKICYLKTDVSCEASVNFHHMPPNAAPAMQSAPCRHLTQPYPMRFAKNTQHDTSKALCLPRLMTRQRGHLRLGNWVTCDSGSLATSRGHLRLGFWVTRTSNHPLIITMLWGGWVGWGGAITFMSRPVHLKLKTPGLYAPKGLQVFNWIG